MSVKIAGVKPRPAEDAIAKLESQLGFLLPQNFEEMLPSINGGLPEPNVFNVDGGESGIVRFLEVTEILRDHELLRFYALGKFFPVAIVETGDRICISAEDGDLGTVYYWDHERVEGRGDLIRLADSISEFIEILRPFDPSTVQLKPGQVKRAWIDPSLLKK